MKKVTRVQRVTDSPEYKAWSSARQRCNNPKNPTYKDYGAKGVEHKISFIDFLLEVGKRPSPKHSIDRIDTFGNYEKGNLKWSLKTEQCQNQRHIITNNYSGVTYHKVRDKWQANLSVGNKLRYLGLFEDKDEGRLAIEECKKLLASPYTLVVTAYKPIKI